MNDECLVHLIDGPSNSGKTLFACFLAHFYEVMKVSCTLIDTNLENPIFGLKYNRRFYRKRDESITIHKHFQIEFDDQLINVDFLYPLLGKCDAIVDVNNSNNLTAWLKTYSHLYPKNIRFVRWCLLPDTERLHDLIELGNIRNNSTKKPDYPVVLVLNAHFANFNTISPDEYPVNHHAFDFPNLFLSGRDRALWNRSVLTAHEMGIKGSPLYQMSRTRFLIYFKKFYYALLNSQLIFSSNRLSRKGGILRAEVIDLFLF